LTAQPFDRSLLRSISETTRDALFDEAVSSALAEVAVEVAQLADSSDAVAALLETLEEHIRAQREAIEGTRVTSSPTSARWLTSGPLRARGW